MMSTHTASWTAGGSLHISLHGVHTVHCTYTFDLVRFTSHTCQGNNYGKNHYCTQGTHPCVTRYLCDTWGTELVPFKVGLSA